MCSNLLALSPNELEAELSSMGLSVNGPKWPLNSTWLVAVE